MEVSLILLPLIFYSIQGIYLKFISRFKLEKVWVSFFYVIAVFILSLFFGLRVSSFNTFLLALANGMIYGMLVFVTLVALSLVDASFLYPIRRLHNPLAAFLIAIVLGEPLTLSKIASIVFATMAILLFQKIEVPKKGFKLAILSLLLLIINAFIVKLGAIEDKICFMQFSYLIASTLLLPVSLRRKLSKKEVLYGCLAGIINFVAFLTLLNALERLPGSLVFPLVGTNVILISFFSFLIFKEKLSRKWFEAFIFFLFSFLFLFA